ncbi:DDE-type integrase/transposase/recombinase, partial [Bradyrhizobium valentinum]|uniref:DDE-type integrase/transposase/recombinase n=1 Tax=Bradyrhizobium valentinum TaxID=1518501 RepID=UPI000B1E1151
SRPQSRRSAANRKLVDDIKQVHRDPRGRYGSPRIHAELKAQGRRGEPWSYRAVDAPSWYQGHHGAATVGADYRQPSRLSDRANPLERNFTAAAPNRIWLADVTYIETDQGWLYLATVMDLYSRRIVGWAMADHLRAELPLAALRMAISVQRPGSGLIHHSDRGVQGGLKRSSQHSHIGGCDEYSRTEIGTIWTSAIAIAGAATGGGA